MNNEPMPSADTSLDKKGRKITLRRLLTPSMDAFGLTPGAALTTFLFIGAAIILAVFWFFQ
jgi:hypothetical protein